MAADFGPVFMQLRGILANHKQGFATIKDTANYFGVEAPPGEATLRSWGGKVRRETIPVAWVEVGNAYVSKSVDDGILRELERVTAESIAGMRKSGFI